MNVLGSWDFGSRLLPAVFELVQGTDGREDLALLVTLCANVAAATGDPTYRSLYGYALSATTDVIDRAILWLRLGTAELKRAGDFQRAIAAVDEMKNIERRCQDGTFSAIEALALNLRALIALRAGDLRLADHCAVAAAASIDSASSLPSDLLEDVVARHRIQIHTNRATMLALAGRHADAAHYMDLPVRIAECVHPESLSEALSIQGYLFFRCAERERAAILLVRAERLLRSEANPLRHKEVRQLLALVRAELGAPNAELCELLRQSSRD